MMDSAEHDVPEEADPFEDDTTDEVVLLDVFKIDPDDIEEEIVLDLRQRDDLDIWLS